MFVSIIHFTFYVLFYIIALWLQSIQWSFASALSRACYFEITEFSQWLQWLHLKVHRFTVCKYKNLCSWKYGIIITLLAGDAWAQNIIIQPRKVNRIQILTPFFGQYNKDTECMYVMQWDVPPINFEWLTDRFHFQTWLSLNCRLI